MKITNEIFKQTCWVALEFAVSRYLIANSPGRESGCEKAMRHKEMCCFYVAVFKDMLPDEVSVLDEFYCALHTATQGGLTDHMNPESLPEGYTFFEDFHRIDLHEDLIKTLLSEN